MILNKFQEVLGWSCLVSIALGGGSSSSYYVTVKGLRQTMVHTYPGVIEQGLWLLQRIEVETNRSEKTVEQEDLVPEASGGKVGKVKDRDLILFSFLLLCKGRGT